jgi:hypothetical protein
MPKIIIMVLRGLVRPPPPDPLPQGEGEKAMLASRLDERTVAFGQRAVGLVARRGGQQLVVVPRTFALGWLLHLEQIGRGEVAAIFADGGLAEAVVLDRHCLHARDGRSAVLLGLGRAHRGDRLQVVQRRRVTAGMVHVGQVVRRLRLDPIGEGAGAIVQVPVEALGQHQALRHIETQRVHVGDKHQQRGDLHGLIDAELAGLLNGVHRIGAGIAQA